jgi:hypothetical protein
MSVPVFKELDKSALDLITKGFPVESHGFEVEGGSAETVKFKATGTHTAAALDALFETTKVISSHGVSLKATVKGEKNVPNYSLEATFEPKKVEGLKATINSECKIPADGVAIDTNKITLLYKRGDLLTIEDSISYSKGKISAAASLSVAYQAIRAGAHALATYTLEGEKKFALGAYGFKLGYVPNKTLSFVAVYDQGEKTTAGASLFFKKDSIEAAGKVTIDPKEPTKVPAFLAAISYAQDAKTTLKAKVATATPSLALSLKHQLSDVVSVTLGSECICPVQEKTVTHKHGLSVNLKL